MLFTIYIPVNCELLPFFYQNTTKDDNDADDDDKIINIQKVNSQSRKRTSKSKRSRVAIDAYTAAAAVTTRKSGKIYSYCVCAFYVTCGLHIYVSIYLSTLKYQKRNKYFIKMHGVRQSD